MLRTAGSALALTAGRGQRRAASAHAAAGASRSRELDMVYVRWNVSHFALRLAYEEVQKEIFPF